MPHLTLLDKGTLKTHNVETLDAVVGRDPASTIYVDGDAAKTVSGRHARFFLADGKWYVEDAGSRNGTFIGTRKLEPGNKHPVVAGDVIGLGLTGTQLLVQEVVARNFAATMMEAPPGPTAEVHSVTVSLKQGAGTGVREAQPVPGQEARFVIAATKGAVRLTGQSDRISIGRALECLIRIEGESATSVSRLHAEVVPISGQVWLRDTGSRHGTFVNGKKIEGPVALRRGDQLTFGPIGQNFTVEEASVVAAGSSPTESRPSASARNAEEAFQSELPTPALPRSALQADDKRPERVQPTPPRGNPSRASPPRAAAAPTLPTVASSTRKARIRMAVGVAAALIIIAIVGFVAYTKGQNSAAGSPPAGDPPQLSSATNSLEITSATRAAAVARASLDSATVIAGQSSDPASRAVLDSLRRSVEAADERLKKASGQAR